MKFKESGVWNAVKRADKQGLDPYLIMAICQQECEHDKDGNYNTQEPRLEEGFRERYVNKFQRDNNIELPTTTEALLAISYGTMQTMGLELWTLGYFEEWFSKQDDRMKIYLGSNAKSQVSVVKALDVYCIDLDSQVKYGIKLFLRKLKTANGDTGKALDYWNGDLTGKYRSEVLARIEPIKARLK